MMPAGHAENPQRPVREAFEDVASITGVPFHQMIGPDRNKRVSHARQMGMFIARERGATSNRSATSSAGPTRR